MSEIQTIILDDTLRYRLVASRTISQEDVKVTALTSTNQHDHAELERRIRSALGTFIKADWTFSSVRRLGEAVGYERVSLRASARVPHSENFNLEDRARRASTEGLSLGEPKVDYSLPAKHVSGIVQELRREIVAEVKKQVREFSEDTQREWRIGDIAFGVVDARSEYPSGKGAYRSSADADSEVPGFEDDELGGVTGTERVILIANVALRAAGRE
jgi:hypothetical protein